MRSVFWVLAAVFVLLLGVLLIKPLAPGNSNGEAAEVQIEPLVPQQVVVEYEAFNPAPEVAEYFTRRCEDRSPYFRDIRYRLYAGGCKGGPMPLKHPVMVSASAYLSALSEYHNNKPRFTVLIWS